VATALLQIALPILSSPVADRVRVTHPKGFTLGAALIGAGAAGLLIAIFATAVVTLRNRSTRRSQR
jgi:hypothetical protein